MQKDFHYYCIAVLARAAGFDKSDALTIGYASQYVDDSTESEPIKVGELPFEPVRTAHIGLEAYKWDVQKKVFIPFHFVPPNPLRRPGDTFITKPDSEFAGQIVQIALEDKDSPQILRLCRIGVALHTYADTWAHENFSGRENDENNVESIYHKKDGRWHHLTWENLYLDFLPEIGHAEADHFPDYPFLTWKYKRKQLNKMAIRENTRIFIRAARAIYDRLLRFNGKENKIYSWGQINGKLLTLLKNPEKDLEKRCWKWRKTFEKEFKPYKYEYDKLAWRKEALNPEKPKHVEWDSFKQSEFSRLAFSMSGNFYDSNWVYFHRAALKQRHFVLENLL
jgi:hypothetical protein